MQYTSGNPFTSIGYKGSSILNGIPVVAQGIASRTKGGILSTSNTTASGNGFGSVLSVIPSSPNEFYYGTVTSGIVAGILQINAGIAQNDPSHATYPLLGQPITVGYEGAYIYNTWDTTSDVTLIDPVIGAKVVFKDSDGRIGFVASGGSAPSGWTLLSNCFVAQVDENGYQGVTVQIKIPS